jgi:hypothetical protein
MRAILHQSSSGAKVGYPTNPANSSHGPGRRLLQPGAEQLGIIGEPRAAVGWSAAPAG